MSESESDDEKKCEIPNCVCGQKHPDANVMVDAMNDLEDMMDRWQEKGVLPSGIVDMFVSSLIRLCEAQDDPDEAMRSLEESLRSEFSKKPEDRTFSFVEEH